MNERMMAYSKMIFFSICLALIFCNSKCKTKKNCHRTITIHNATGQTVIYAYKLASVSTGECRLYGEDIVSNGSFDENIPSCWEDRLGGDQFEFYIIDPSKKSLNVDYPCDSIPTKNKILKVYSVSLSELKSQNFNIYYP